MNGLQALAKGIAEHLGEPWKYHNDAEYNWRAKISRNDGAEIGIRTTGGVDIHRLRISGIYPGNHLPYGTTPPSITVAISRGEEAIAKDIRRRFLPKYLPLFEQNMRLKAKDDEFYCKQQEAKESLAKILNGDIIFDHSIRFDGPGDSYGSVDVCGSTATVKLSSMDLETAHRLARFLTSKEAE